MKTLGKYSFGTGDRFGKQGKAQLSALLEARNHSLEIVPVWNKSYREHKTVHTHPESVRKEADSTVEALGYSGPYFVDADHINADCIDLFVDTADFFTLDVADFIGGEADEEAVRIFTDQHMHLCDITEIRGISGSLQFTPDFIRAVAGRYLPAVSEAGKLYRHIESRKGAGNFITEVSMDETDSPQTPEELLIILAAISSERIPAQTIAPKFTGRFNKGVDYSGDLARFEREFFEDLAVIDFAVGRFDLPKNLKLSIHSGSDKFSIYPIINRAIHQTDAGIHVKTAGTTWLEELIGLSESGEEGSKIVHTVYRKAYDRYDELTAPYSSVIDIDMENLPHPDEFDTWTEKKIAQSVRHDLQNPLYNIDIRQLLHVGYKVAAEMGDDFLSALDRHAEVIAEQVYENLWERHIKRIFM